MDYVFNRRHSSPWSDNFWSLQHMPVVCVSQLTCLVEEMIETRFLGSWIWIVKHPPIKLPYDKKTLARFEAWYQSWTPGMFTWVVTPGPLCVPFPGSQVFLYRMGLDMDIVTWKVIVSRDLVTGSELRVRWQNETLGSVAFYSDWGFFGFMI